MAAKVSAEAHVPHTLDAIHNKEHDGSGAPVITVHDEADVIEVTHKRPYGEMNFIGTYVAVGLGACACYGGFVMPATSLALIEADLGGPPSAGVWIVLSWTLCLSVGYVLVGRLSDIFGRRWFFIGASCMATMGCIIGGTANSLNQIIAGNAFIGLATAAQLSFQYILPELVPMKDRFYVLSGVFLFALPFSGFGPVISRLLIVHTKLGWRWDFYMNVIVNGVSALLYVIFYHPPDFDELHKKRRTRMQELKNIDWGGIVLFLAGLILLLLGLSWGGTLHPWKSAAVISTLIIGFFLCVAFVLYETYMPLKRPLVPMHLFLERDFCVLTIISAVGGMLYYSLNVVYPTMVGVLFTQDIVRGGLLSCAIGGGVAAGQFSASLWAKPGGFFRWKLFFSVICCTAFTAGLAGAKTEHTASGLAVMSAFFIGALESLAGVALTIVIKDQTELGVAVGVYGSIRSVAGALATAILVTILTTRVKHASVAVIAPALVKAGLPVDSVGQFLADLGAGDVTSALAVPGANEKLLELGAGLLTKAYANAFKLLYLVTIAFGGCSCIAAFFSPSVEQYYTGDVMRRLHKGGGKRETPADAKTAEIEHHEHGEKV